MDQIVESTVDWALNLIVPDLEPEKQIPPSNEPTPLELKTLPHHFKYVYLGGEESLPVIIGSHLMVELEENLISVLRKHRSYWLDNERHKGIKSSNNAT